MIHEDDHYKTWRYRKPHRDIENQTKFLGFKAFQHKPHHDMDKYYTERERREMSYNANKSRQLVKQEIIPKEQVSRSLRSQGPLNPKHAFRELKTDKHYFQPRMRYTNITDRERMLENSISYDDKFKSVYE